MTFGFALVLAGFILLDSGWKGVTPAQTLRGMTAGQKGPGGVLREAAQGTLVSFTGGNAEETNVPAGEGTTSSAGYVSPFRGGEVTTGRIDQGQDFGGTGPVRAIGNARILKVGAPGWPGGKGVLYELITGPLKGKIIYVYEGINPTVRAGQTVRTGAIIGHIIPGSSTGIEMGFADRNGVPLSHGEYTEGKETIFGKAFARFLKTLSE